MIIYSLDNLSLREIRALRKSLDFLPITGVDATFIAVLQNKITTQIAEVESHIKQEEKNKQTLLQEAINPPSKPPPSKRGKNS